MSKDKIIFYVVDCNAKYIFDGNSTSLIVVGLGIVELDDG